MNIADVSRKVGHNFLVYITEGKQKTLVRLHESVMMSIRHELNRQLKKEGSMIMKR